MSTPGIAPRLPISNSTPADQLVELEPAAGVTVVAVRGEVDLATGDDLRTALQRAVESSPAVLVDLSGCTFIDSTGLHALLVCRRRAEERQVAVAISCAPQGAAARLFELALPGVLAVHPDRESGLAALRAGA